MCAMLVKPWSRFRAEEADVAFLTNPITFFVPLWMYLGWREIALQALLHFRRRRGLRAPPVRTQEVQRRSESSFSSPMRPPFPRQTVRRTKNGVYHGTNFYFHWYSSNTSKPIYSITGNHMADSKTPPPGNLFNFASAVESAWYRYATPKIEAEFAKKGAVKFYLGGKYSCPPSHGVIDFIDEHGKLSRAARTRSPPPSCSTAKSRSGARTSRRNHRGRSVNDRRFRRPCRRRCR